MFLTINNQIKIENPTSEVIDYISKTLVIDNPDYISAERNGRWTGNIEKKLHLYVKRGDTYYLPFGCYKDLWEISHFDFKTDFSPFKSLSMQGGITLREYQEKALQGLLKAKNGILEARCGAGKTMVGLELIHKIGGKALWLTHTSDLLKQSKARCEAYFKGDFGTITEGKVDIGSDITFATVQTLSKLDVDLYKNEFTTVVVDECHHCVGSPTRAMMFYKVLNNLNCRYKYGMSATLERADSLIKSMYALLGGVAYTITQEEVGANIIKAIHSKVEIDLDYNIEDYTEADGSLNYNNLITMLSFDENRNKIIVDRVLDNLNKRQLILVHRVNHAKVLAEMIGHDCVVITGSTAKSKRDFSAKIIISTYQLAKEGLDIPALEVLHLATPQANKTTTQQSVGRIERVCEGKADPIAFDYVDTSIQYCNYCYAQRRRFLKK